MRILMIWSENLNKPGSGRTHFVHLAHGLAALGHSVRLVAPGYPPKTTEDLGVPVSYVPTLRRSMAAFILFHVLLVPAMPWLILRYRPHAVYSRGLFHSFLVHILCRMFLTPYVAEVDSMVDEELAMRRRTVWAGLVRCADRWNLRWASAFICVTQGLRKELIRRGARPDRVVALHNGAAVELFTPGDQSEARRRLGLSQDAVLVGFIGTLAAWQGLDLLVDATGRLPDRQRRWEVLIVGDGPMRDDLVRQIASLRLEDRVRLIPAVDHDRVVEYLRAVDMAVIPIHDPRKLRYGLSALKFWEALSVGLPVLVPDAGDLGGVLGELGWPGEFRAGDAGALAQAMDRTAARLDELHARQREIHEAVARDHSWAAVARQTVAVFDQLGAAQRGGRS